MNGETIILLCALITLCVCWYTHRCDRRELHLLKRYVNAIRAIASAEVALARAEAKEEKELARYQLEQGRMEQARKVRRGN